MIPQVGISAFVSFLSIFANFGWPLRTAKLLLKLYFWKIIIKGDGDGGGWKVGKMSTEYLLGHFSRKNVFYGNRSKTVFFIFFIMHFYIMYYVNFSVSRNMKTTFSLCHTLI